MAKITNIEDLLDAIEKASDKDKDLALGDVLDSVGHRSFGPLLLLAGLVMAAPGIGDIPGIPTATGIFTALVAGQMIIAPRLFMAAAMAPEAQNRRQDGLQGNRTAAKAGALRGSRHQAATDGADLQQRPIWNCARLPRHRDGDPRNGSRIVQRERGGRGACRLRLVADRPRWGPGVDCVRIHLGHCGGSAVCAALACSSRCQLAELRSAAFAHNEIDFHVGKGTRTLHS